MEGGWRRGEKIGMTKGEERGGKVEEIGRERKKIRKSGWRKEEGKNQDRNGRKEYRKV